MQFSVQEPSTIMSLAMYDFTIPAAMRGLDVLLSYLDHMENRVGSGGADEGLLLHARLAPDILTLGQQIRMACDNAKNGPARLAGRPAPVFADNEVTVADFRERVARTKAFLDTFSPDDFKGSEGRMISQSFRRADYALTGSDYLQMILLPNLYFHIATAHGILRHNGFDIGKLDYYGRIPDVRALATAALAGSRSIRFLTTAECSAWITAHDLVEDPVANDTSAFYFQFAPQPLQVDLRELICFLMEDFGVFTGGLLRITDWIWDDEYDNDPTIAIREAHGEARSLSDVPGFLFGAGGVEAAAGLLALVIERRWTARFYFSSKNATLQLCEGDRVDVYSIDGDVEERVRYRLIEAGAGFPQP
jgi:hypothetical protein